MTKVADFSVFVTQVALYDIVPMPLVRIASYCILASEITLGSALILGYFSRGASILSVGLFGIFICVLTLALWRALPLDDCGCENILFDLFHWDADLSWKEVFIDLVLLVVCLFVASTDSGGYGIDSFVRKDTLSGGNYATDTNH